MTLENYLRNVDKWIRAKDRIIAKERTDGGGSITYDCPAIKQEMFKLLRISEVMRDCLTPLCAWDDGEIGGHMDHPSVSWAARTALSMAEEIAGEK